MKKTPNQQVRSLSLNVSHQTTQLTKYNLNPPLDRKPLNDRLGIAEFFPPNNDDEENRITPKTIAEGFFETFQFKFDEYGSFRDRREELLNKKGELLQTVKQIEWFKSSSHRNLKKNLPKRDKDKQNFPKQIPDTKQSATWFQSLMGTKPLRELSSAIPHGFLLYKQDKDLKENLLLDKLILHRVPLLRATWFIKIIYLNNISSNKKGGIDPSDLQRGWTEVLLAVWRNHMLEFLSKSTQELKESFLYMTKLISWNYYEGLLNNETFLEGLLNLLSNSLRPEESSLIFYLCWDFVLELCHFSKTLVTKWLNVLIDKLNQYTSINKGEENSFLNNLINSIYSIIRIFFLAIPDSFSSLDYQKLGNCFQLIQNQFEDSKDKLLILFQRLYKEQKPIIENLHSIHQVFSKNLPSPFILRKFEIIHMLDDINNQLSIEHLQVVFQTIFDVRDQPHFVEWLYLLCEWACTLNRIHYYNRINISLFFLTKYKQTFSIESENLQTILSEFLDKFEPRNPSEIELVSLFFGELIRYKFFSHNSYVRNLISRGILEEKESKYIQYLIQFPIINISNSRHELNQRRASLNYIPGLVSRESKFIRESIQKWNDFNNHFPFSVNKVDSFFLELAGSSRYCQLQISEILYQTIKSNCLDSVNNSSLIDSSTHISSPFGDPSSPSSSSPLSFSVQLNFSKEGTSKIDNPEKLFFALTTFEVLNDINSLLDLLIWLLQCSPFHIFGFVILKFIKRYESAFLCQNNLNVIFDILIEKYQTDQSNSEIYDYLSHLIKKYQFSRKNQVESLPPIQTQNSSMYFVEEEDIQLYSVARSLKNQEFQSIEQFISHINSIVTSDNIVELAFLLLRCATRFPQITTICIQFFKHSTQLENAFQRNTFFLFIELLVWNGTIDVKYLFHEMIIPQLKDQQNLKANLIGLGLLDVLLKNHPISNKVYHLSDEIFNVIAPILNLTHLWLSDKFKMESNYDFDHILTSLLNSTHFQKICMQKFSIFNQFLKEIHFENEKTELPFNVKLASWKLISYFKHFSEDFKQWKEEEISLDGKIDIVFKNFSEDFKQWKKEEISLDGEIGVLIKKCLSNLNCWNLNFSLLYIRILASFFPTTLSTPFLIENILIQLFKNLDPSMFKIIIGLRLTDEFLTRVDQLLSNLDVLTGKQTLLNQFFIEIKKENKQEIDEMDEGNNLMKTQTSNSNCGLDQQDKTFIDLLVTFCLPKISQIQKIKYISSLSKQFESLLETMDGENLPLEEILFYDKTLASDSQFALINSLRLRLPLLTSLLPILASTTNIEETEKIIYLLLIFMTKPFIQQFETDLILPILNIIQVLVQESNQPSIKETIKKNYNKLIFPPAIKDQIEQTLPFVRQKLVFQLPEKFTSSSNTGIPQSTGQKRNLEKAFDPWTMLEDYVDAPPSPPTHLGAEKIDRETLTYTSLLLKRKKIH